MSRDRFRVGRRAILEGGIGLLFGQSDAASSFPKTGDFLVRAGGNDLKPLTPDDIALNEAPATAWAIDPADKTVRSGSRLNAVLLARFDPSRLSALTRSRAAEGVVAYTAICTHSGCEVSDWLADNQILSCPCHDSLFDPKDEGKVVDGPAPRSLPALPLNVVDGKLAVAGPFTSRVGFEGL